MKKLPFKSSPALTLGVELEFQIIDPITHGLTSRAKDMIRIISESHYSEKIKPEITQSMIEINSAVHHTPHEMHQDLKKMRNFLFEIGNNIQVKFSGGGTHPFQQWSLEKIFPTVRFKHLAHQYKYLSKRATVFGQHVHIGCANPEDAIYLVHALSRYVPQLIAISSASPFYQGIDTGYQSARANIFKAFPQSGVMPYLLDWKTFSEFFYKMRKLGIIKTMKDFYWDIRPKPEFGTVEIRVCDTPLTIKKAVIMAAYLQALAHYLLRTRIITITEDLYYLYNHNKFQAGRYGLKGDFIDPNTLKHTTIQEDFLNTLRHIEEDVHLLNNNYYINELKSMILNNDTDADYLRKLYKATNSFEKIVEAQCKLWSEHD